MGHNSENCAIHGKKRNNEEEVGTQEGMNYLPKEQGKNKAKYQEATSQNFDRRPVVQNRNPIGEWREVQLHSQRTLSKSS